MMVVTHEMGFARKVANRVIFMDRGQIVEDAPKDDFFGKPRSERLRGHIRSLDPSREKTKTAEPPCARYCDAHFGSSRNISNAEMSACPPKADVCRRQTCGCPLRAKADVKTG